MRILVVLCDFRWFCGFGDFGGFCGFCGFCGFSFLGCGAWLLGILVVLGDWMFDFGCLGWLIGFR